MNRRKFSTLISIALFMGAVLSTPALAGMGGGSGGGGMGGSGGDNGGPGVDGNMGAAGVDGANQQVGRMKSAPGRVTFESMHRSSTGAMADGGVKMDLEPYSFEDGTFRVKFFANTHTVNLGDYDLMGRTHLEYEDVGYKPVSVAKMRGHHAGGEIIFRVPEVPEHFRIIVRGLPDMEERIFEW